MKKTLVLAALLAATAFTPAFAQDVATAAEPTPIPERVMIEMSQNERGMRDRGPRGGSEARSNDGGQDRGAANFRRQRQEAPVAQAAPVQQTAAPAAPIERQRNRGSEGYGQNRAQRRDAWQGQMRDNARVVGDPAGAVVVQQQTDRNWSRQTRNDGQGNRVFGNDTQRRDGQLGNGRRNDSWQGNRQNGGQWDGNRRNDAWRNDTWRNENRRNDTWRNNGQWDGARRNDTWRNNTWRNDTWRNNGGVFDQRFDQRNQWRDQYRNWNRSWNRDWRRDQRFDWQRYRFANRGLFQGGRYFAPNGWDFGYRRFSIGFGLSPLLFGQRYWINDPFNFRLPPADGPYRWVRYYDDVLLVDLRSGEVVDAIYDFFW